jgi:ATP-dependent DNA helicase DinG
MEGYEPRPQQTALAEAVEKALKDRTHLLAEAGTGTGKSFATLIPAILSGQRVIISTATKALQDQLAFKDLPFLHKNLGVKFSSTILKGRSNYLCLNRLGFSDVSDQIRRAVLNVVHQRAKARDVTFTGERDQLPEMDYREWMEIQSDSDECGDCQADSCFAQRARETARMSQIVVVNHALYMTELMVKDKSDGFAQFLGPHSFVVFDEAHNIEDYAANALSDQINIRGIENTMGEVVNVVGSYDRNQTSRSRDLTAAVLTPAKELWDTFKPGRLRSNDILDNADLYVDLTNALHDLAEWVKEQGWPLSAKASAPTEKRRKASARRKVNNLHKVMQKVVTEDFATTLRFIEERETRKRGEKRLDLKYGPIDVSSELRRLLFGDTGVTAVLVSATLATNGKFDYIAGRLGVDHFDELDVGTPFDYQTQACFYVPDDLPDPRDDAWSSLSVQRMRDLLKMSDGRALLLFTSIKEMRSAYDTISALVPYNCLVQYSEPNKVLAEKFREDTHSILFATKSFMEGVDFQGDTLSLVIVNKCPFPVPSEPITEARIENIEAKGGNSFFDYMVPVMTLTLKQAVGRLIRNKTDRGVYAILDTRILKKGYGKGIIKSLPDAPLTSDLGVVEAMYS